MLLLLSCRRRVVPPQAPENFFYKLLIVLDKGSEVGEDSAAPARTPKVRGQEIVADLKKQLKQYDPRGPNWITEPLHAATAKEAAELVEWLNQEREESRDFSGFLDKVRFQLDIAKSYSLPAEMYLIAKLSEGELSVEGLVSGRHGNPALTIGGRNRESKWYISLMSLGEMIYKLTRCEYCGKWTFSPKKAKRFCSRLCQRKWYRKKEAYILRNRSKPKREK